MIALLFNAAFCLLCLAMVLMLPALMIYVEFFEKKDDDDGA